LQSQSKNSSRSRKEKKFHLIEKSVSNFLDRSNTFGLIDAGHHVFKPAAPGTLCHSDEIIRSPDIHVGRLRFYHGFFFLLSSFLRHVSELAKRNSTEIGHMLGSKCDLKNACPKSGAYFPPTNRGEGKTPFSTTAQLNSNFNGLHLWNKT